MDLNFQENPYLYFEFYRPMDYEIMRKSLYITYNKRLAMKGEVLSWKRKVFKMRYSNYVALPPEWVRKYGVNHVEVILENDGSLRVIPSEREGDEGAD